MSLEPKKHFVSHVCFTPRTNIDSMPALAALGCPVGFVSKANRSTLFLFQALGAPFAYRRRGPGRRLGMRGGLRGSVITA